MFRFTFKERSLLLTYKVLNISKDLQDYPHILGKYNNHLLATELLVIKHAIEACSEPSKTFKMELFAKIAKVF